jgi:hypothetical protein
MGNGKNGNDGAYGNDGEDGSVAGEGFVEVEDDAADLGPGGEFGEGGGVSGIGGRGLAELGEGEGFLGLVGVVLALAVEEGLEAVTFDDTGGPGEGALVEQGEAVGVGSGLVEEVGGEDAGGFDKAGVVEEGQGLLGGVGLEPTGDAFLAGRGVEIGEHGMEEGALPMHVEPTAVLSVVGAGVVAAVGELEVGVVIGGLIGEDAGAADIGLEEAGDGQGVVADELGVETARGLIGQPGVAWIEVAGAQGGDGFLAVGGGSDEEADHVADIPTGITELDGQPIEEFRVGGPFALEAEILGTRGDAGAEELGPEAVHQVARGEGIVGGDQPLGEVKAGEATSGGRWGDAA